MKKIALYISLLFLIIFSTLSIKAQTLTLTAGSVCANNSVISVPVSVQNMQNVFGFHLNLHYNSNIMTYAGYNVLSPALFNSSVMDSSNTGNITMHVYQGTTPLNVQNGYIYSINFIVDSLVTNAVLQWDSVIFFGQGGTIIPSVQVNGAVVLPPVFTLQPVDQSVCEGTNFTVAFSAHTIDTSQACHWQVLQNGTWTNLVNDIHYHGVTTQTLTIVSPQTQMNNNLYRCMLIGPCTVYSDEALLIILSNILTQPHDTLINVGGTAVFRAEVNGTSPTYLWEVSTDGGTVWSSSVLFPTITTPNITISEPPVSWNGYKFRCIVTGQCSPPSDTTNIATLWVGTAGIEERTGIVYSIFPNPAADYFNITFNNSTTFNFILYDITGRQMVQINKIKTDLLTIPRQNFNTGIYFYRIIDAESGVEASGKIVFN